MTAYPHLFEPGAIGGLAIRNRIVQPPMGTGLVENGRLSPRDVAFQEERARAGVGLIVTGAAAVHPTSLFPVRIIVEAWDEDGIDALRARVDAVQRHGARIFGQLVHLGRESPGGLTNTVPMAPSPVASARDPNPPHEMSVAEVRMIADAFATSAVNLQAAGYDGVEIAAGHGYLVAQFLSPASNRRTAPSGFAPCSSPDPDSTADESVRSGPDVAAPSSRPAWPVSSPECPARSAPGAEWS